MRISDSVLAIAAVLGVLGFMVYIVFDAILTPDEEQEQSLESAVYDARAENRAAEWATITRTKALSVDEELIEIRIPHDRLPGVESLDRVCYVYKNRALNAVSLVCRP